MKKIISLFIGFLVIFSSYAQIDMKDSTVQIVAYWEKGEKMSYVLTKSKYKINNTDSVLTQQIKYDVDVTIVDSTAKSYICEWVIHKPEVIVGREELKKIFSEMPSMKYRIKTNELGVFQDLLNWKEIKKENQNLFTKLSKTYKDNPIITDFFKQTMKQTSTKEGIKKMSEDILHFYFFYGLVYKLGEPVEAASKVPFLFSDHTLDSKCRIGVVDLFPEDQYSILYYTEFVDPNQVKEACNSMLNSLIKADVNLFKSSDNEMYVSEDSYILTLTSGIHETGWPLYWIYSISFNVESYHLYEEFTMEMKFDEEENTEK